MNTMHAYIIILTWEYDFDSLMHLFVSATALYPEKEMSYELT